MWTIKKIENWYALSWNGKIYEWYKSKKEATIAVQELEFKNV